MMKLVVDASVAFEWALPDEHAEDAARVLDGAHELWAPDLLLIECGNALWKRVRRGEMTSEEAGLALDGVSEVPVRVVPSWSLVPMALGIACDTGCTVYDSLYLALAIDQQAVLVTADRRLLAAVSDGPLARHVTWVAEIA